ncbi:MAG TPA: glycosyltransferase family 2 protein [Anaerolineales bacterium]|nr:glycosyltransferase family 2 protein [Anaerolineales bacterium]
MTEMHLVSIVTPSYNQAQYLEQTIQSVLEQDYPRIEYIVIDGASTDSSFEIIKKYADHLAYWISEKDRGQAEAINKGFVRANGEILAWLNSDDYYMPKTVSAVVECFEEHPDVVMVYGDMLAVDGNGQTINILKYKQLSLEDLLCFQIIGQPSVFFRRAALEKAGWLEPTFHFMLDHHLWIRLAQQGRILHVPQVWSAARYHAQAKNRARAAEFGREAFRVLDWARSQPELAEVLSGVGRRAVASAHRYDARYLLDGGQTISALGAWFRALLLHPPTALARLNILVSALLNLTGLSRLRDAILRRRQRRLSGKR